MSRSIAVGLVLFSSFSLTSCAMDVSSSAEALGANGPFFTIEERCFKIFVDHPDPLPPDEPGTLYGLLPDVVFEEPTSDHRYYEEALLNEYTLAKLLVERGAIHTPGELALLDTAEVAIENGESGANAQSLMYALQDTNSNFAVEIPCFDGTTDIIEPI